MVRKPNGFDAAALKQQAAGRWPEILCNVGGLSPDILDGKHHACPKCGGTDRFRMIDVAAGALFCNQCFNHDNGDGIAALQWLRGGTFTEARNALAEHLGQSSPRPNEPAGNGKSRIVATYDYRDERGELLYQVVRFDPKDFRQRQPKPGGGWEWSVKGIRLVPYRLREMLAADPSGNVLIVEGEKDADRAASMGIVATTCAMGAGKWRPEYNEHLCGRNVVIVPDNDKPGREHANQVAQSLCGMAGSIKVVELPGVPEKGDLSDWLDQGGTKDKLAERVSLAPEWKPSPGDKQPPPFTRLLTGAELLALDLRPRFLVRGVLVESQPMILGGRSKVLKTSIALDLAVSLGTGTPFLGRFESHRVGVGFWSGESGAATIRETAKRIADSKGVDLAAADVLWCFDLPRLSDLLHLDAIAETIRHHGLKVAIFDPLYLCLLSPETAGGASNLFMMGSLLQGLTRLGQQTGCTIILLHHFRKTGQSDDDNPASLEELAQSGVAEWARQWLLLQRRVSYQGDGQHPLWLRCGGSAGHSSLWGVTIDEGIIDPDTFSGRKWEAAVSPAADAREEAQRDKANRKAAEQEQREGEHRERLLVVLRQTPGGDTERALSRAAGLNPENFGRAVFSLLQEGRAARCEVVKTGRNYDGFRPTGR